MERDYSFISSIKKKYWGFELIFKYPIVKILDYKGKELELKKDKNPFSEVVIVQLQAMEISSKTDTEKKELKSKLIRGLYKKGYKRDEIINLFKFIDWAINLSKEKEVELIKEINQYKEVIGMPLRTPAEQIL